MCVYVCLCVCKEGNDPYYVVLTQVVTFSNNSIAGLVNHTRQRHGMLVQARLGVVRCPSGV